MAVEEDVQRTSPQQTEKTKLLKNVQFQQVLKLEKIMKTS